MKHLNFYTGKKVLVTGGAGFIGSHLCDALLTQGAQVRVLDNFSSGSLQNLAGSLPALEIIPGTICSIEDSQRACQGIDITLHLAAEISVAGSHNDPLPAMNTNIQGTCVILEACRSQGVKRVVFASSAAVYGNHQGICSEELIPEPVSTYGYSKLIGEQLCQLYSKTYFLETVSLRFFNVYGPRQNPKGGDGGVLAVFNEKLKDNQPITIFGDGLQTRDFVPVQTVVNAILAAGMLQAPIANGQPFNVGTGTSVTLLSKLEELKAQYPAYSQAISHIAERPGDIRHSQADCSKLQRAIRLLSPSPAHSDASSGSVLKVLPVRRSFMRRPDRRIKQRRVF